MKIIKYRCDRCGKTISKDGLYTIMPERYDPDNDGITADIPDDLYTSLTQIGEDKHLCLDCLRRGMEMAFRAPAKINPEFEAAVKDMEQQYGRKEIQDAVKQVEEISSGSLSPTKKKGYPADMTDVAVRAMLMEGKTNQEIADHFGVTKKQVESFIYTHKIQRAILEETERP